ncbi:MAG: choice-of-anchor M domain-containing protein, partial [Planctomycetota bacterium]
NFFEDDHGDIRIGYADGRWSLDVNPDALDGPFAPDEVLIVAGPDSQTTAPAGTEFDFLGAEAGSEIYLLPQTGVPPTIPDLGTGGEGIEAGAFASYDNADPRVDATGTWVELRLVDMRGPDGGEFSVYSSTLDGPNVWIATSDGIDEQDGKFIQAGSHNHFNWAFTEPGIYEVDVYASAFLDRNDNGTFDEGVDPYTESGIVTYYFSVDPPNGPEPYTIPSEVESVDVQLLPVAMPSAAELTGLPDAIDSVSVGESYYVEVWVQDTTGQSGGIAGGHIDIQYTTELLDALQLTHESFNVLQSGVIDDAAGLIDDFGGGTLTQQQAVAPGWARLGYVEVLATSVGEAEYSLLPGSLPFATFGGGNIEFDDVDLTDIAAVTHTEALQLDFAVLREPWQTHGDGHVEQIPDSESYLHEWEPFYVEVYLSNASDAGGVQTVDLDLTYNTSITTAHQFIPGPSFEFPSGLPLFDDVAGSVSDIQLIATEMGLGVEPVLVGHVVFAPAGSDDVAVNEAGDQILGPGDLGLMASAVAEVADQEAHVATGQTPDTAIWAVPYDVDDSDRIDFADFSVFAAAFGEAVGGPEPPFARWADFDGSGMVDFDDLAYLDANQGLTVDDFAALTFASAYPTSELALPPAASTEAPELSEATLESFSEWGPFNNGKNTYDVNNSGDTSPLDALLVINALNTPSKARPYFLDVNDDGQMSPLDALWVINQLNRTQAERAAATDQALSVKNASAPQTLSGDTEDEEMLDLIAADQQLF